MLGDSSMAAERSKKERENLELEEAKKRRTEWEVAAQEVSPEEFTEAQEAMIREFGGAISPTVEDVLKFRTTRR